MRIKDIIFNNPHYKRNFEIHISKEASLDRLKALVDEKYYDGEFYSNGFQLKPKWKFLEIYGVSNTRVSGEFKNDEAPYKLEVTIQMALTFQILVTLLYSMMLVIFVGLIFVEAQILVKLVLIFILLTVVYFLRDYSHKSVNKSDKMLLGYLYYLFKPLELKVVNG